MKKITTVIDLSHTLMPGMPVFPGDEFPDFSINSTIEENGYKETMLSMSAHTGTHLDAPCHVLQNGKTITDLEMNRFYGIGCVINCTDLKADETIEVALLRKHESRIKKADFVLLYTGISSLWRMPEYFEKFPVLNNQAASYLLQFNLKGIGMDTPSVDPVASVELEIHHLLLDGDLIIIENLTNLISLPDKNFYFCCFPLKIDGSDGSPVRAFAII